MNGLVIKDLTIQYHQHELALDNVNLTLPPKSLCIVLGASGCGKSTLLNAIAGFIPASAGKIIFNDTQVKGAGADRAVVFQDNALFPWLNVEENVSFAGKLSKINPKVLKDTTQQILQWVGLEQVAKKSIWELSGGMQQRVGIARVLASQAQMLLLDEPFAALDAFMRENMQELLLTIWKKSGKQILLISHDIEEALFLATDLIVMGKGKILHHYTPRFNEQWQNGISTRHIKSDSEFIAWREKLFQQITSYRI